MKATLLAENLKKGLSIALRAVSNRAQLPILSSVLLKADKKGLVLMATDLELSFRVNVRAKVEVEGEIALPAKLFMELVNTLPVGIMELVIEKQTLSLQSGKVKAEVLGQASEEFPSLPSSTGNGITLDIDELKKKVERIGVAAAKDDSRPILTGILWVLAEKKITLVATDGYRLGVDEMSKAPSEIKEDDDRFVLPVRALMELIRVVDSSMKSLTVEFDRTKQQVIFATEDLEMSSRLIAGDFPPYTKVIPVDKNISVEMSKEELVEAVKRASLFAKDSANVVKLLVNQEGVMVTAQSDQMGGSQTLIEAEIEGEEVRIAFNARYLLEYLGILTGDKVYMETEGELKAVVFRVPDEEFIHVIMPVRTQG